MAEITTWADLKPAPSIYLLNSVEFAALNTHGIMDISPHTVRWFRSSVISLSKVIGDLEITAVTVNHIARWQEAKIKDGVSEITINSYLRSLKTLFNRLYQNRLITNNPAQPIKPLPEPQPNPKAITELDYLLMREAAANIRDKAVYDTTIRDTAIIDTLWSTGCRAGELVGMDVNRLEIWSENGRSGAAIKVKGKNRKIRSVYWEGEQVDSLIAWKEQRPLLRSPALFTTQYDKRFTLSGFSALIRQIRIIANVTEANTNPHAFRHAFAIRHLNNGIDLATVSQWLGHSSPEFTAKVYCVRSEDELRKRFFEQR